MCLAKRGKKLLIDLDLNNNGFNIIDVIGFNEGDQLLFNKSEYNQIIFRYSFDNLIWNSSYQLSFQVEDCGKLKYIDNDFLFFKGSQFDTPYNNKKLQNVIKEINGKILPQ